METTTAAVVDTTCDKYNGVCRKELYNMWEGMADKYSYIEAIWADDYNKPKYVWVQCNQFIQGMSHVLSEYLHNEHNVFVSNLAVSECICSNEKYFKVYRRH